MTGALQIRRSGAAFLRTESPDDGDIRIEPRSLRGAFDGDTVLVRLTARARQGRLAEGAIVKVLERKRQLIRGTFLKTKKGGVVVSRQGDLQTDIVIPAGADGEVAHGEKVLARVTSEPSDARLSGEVVLGLADEGSLRTDVEAIRLEFELPGAHPEPLVQAAAAFPSAVDGAADSDRRDARAIETFTIDPVEAKDFDDAVSIEDRGAGSVCLGVHIADVAHYVQSGSPLDEEAARRGTSIYLPGWTIPMLPERLADDLCSLRPDADRLAVSVFLTFAADGMVEDVEIVRSVIRSRRRFSYEEVQAIFDWQDRGTRGPDLPRDHTAYEASLSAMRRLRAVLFEAREARGALAMDIPKLQLVLGADGSVESLGEQTRDEAHAMIEEFMLVANEAVARHLTERRLPLVGRVHPEPDPDKLIDLQTILKASGFRLRGGASPRGFQRLVEEVVDTPMASAVQIAMLRAMGHAEYVSGVGLHFALATDHYCHFTSPIRRYPDLLVHQILGAHLTGKLKGARRRAWEERLPLLAEQASATERRAEAAERAMIQLRLVRYLEPLLGQQMEGWVISVHAFGFFVQIPTLLLEGLVHVATLNDYYGFDEDRLCLQGRRNREAIRLGDPVTVVLCGLDAEAREISFRLVQKARGKTE